MRKLFSQEANKTMTSLQAVNKVRNRANFANLQNVTMDDVKHERVLELALEGHRFYDLLRWGELSSVSLI